MRQIVGREARAGKHKKATGANSSPVTDGECVWVYFKSGELACLDLATGAERWRVNLQERFGEDTLWWDLGTSPVLTAKAVVVAVMQTGPSYLAAFDRVTGELRWKHDRDVPAPEEAAQSYSTPLVTAGDSTRGEPAELLVVLGADHVTAHDAANGTELWRVGGLNPEANGFFRSIASPVLAGDLVIAPYARGGTITAIRRGGSGDVTGSHLAWVRRDIGADVPTPAESGIKGVDLVLWFGMFAPAQTPPAVVARLNREIRAALEQPELRSRLQQQGIATEGGTGEALAAQVSADIARYRVLATQINLNP
jgi:hypothetical protein